MSDEIRRHASPLRQRPSDYLFHFPGGLIPLNP